MKRILILLLVLLLPSGAWASKVALVIGNSAYSAVEVLDNPQNDARDVAAALMRQGFEVVRGDDLSRVQMRDLLRRFREKADAADVALVYYAGHGIEISGRNYLVPVDARLEDERDAELEMVELDLVLGQISGARALKMVVLDACRNNPFVVRMKRSTRGRSVRSGLGRIEHADADTLIAYAAAAGGITPDGTPGGNSPFTAAFVASLEGPPTDVRRLLGRVRDKMRQTVPGAAPFVYTSLGGGEFIINPQSPRQKRMPNLPTGPQTATAQTPGSISADFVRIDRSGSFADWNDFLVRHEGQSDHPLYAFALEKRESLRPKNGAAPRPPRQNEQVAALGFGTDELARPREEPRNLAIVAPKVELTEDQAKRRLQTLLRDAGCYRGRIDGILGRGSRRGIDGFARQADVGFPANTSAGGAALRDAIALIEANPGTKCPAPVVVRKAPKRTTPTASRTTPKPQVSPTAVAPQSAAPTTRPGGAITVTLPKVTVPKVVRRNSRRNTQQEPLEIPVEGSREPRRTKLTPSPGEKQIFCTGPRKKFYNCD